MTPLEIGGMTLFILVLLFGTFSIIFGFPGSFIILIDVFFYAVFTGFERIGPKILIILLILSVLAELADFVAGMAGAVKFGSSRKALWGFFIGGMIGAVLLMPFLLGLGAVVGTFFGGFIGILIVEMIRQSRLKPALRAAYGAILGRAVGMCIKGFFALIMVVITLSNVYN